MTSVDPGARSTDDPAARTPAVRARRLRRLVTAAALVGGTVIVVGTSVTSAAFTDVVRATTVAPVGGAYEIALIGPDGELVSGDPDPLVVEEVVTGADGSRVVDVSAVTTTVATGPVTLSLVNAREEQLPPDPGIPGPGADPFDVAVFTVRVDGQVLVEAVPSESYEPVVISGWETDVPRAVQVTVEMPEALGNPYYSGRSMSLGLQLDGSTS